MKKPRQLNIARACVPSYSATDWRKIEESANLKPFCKQTITPAINDRENLFALSYKIQVWKMKRRGATSKKYARNCARRIKHLRGLFIKIENKLIALNRLSVQGLPAHS